MLLMNIGLGLFNLLPIPPLDGSHVLESLLPTCSGLWQIERYAPIILLSVFLPISSSASGSSPDSRVSHPLYRPFLCRRQPFPPMRHSE
jgi:Zn-dependent protease